MIISTKIGQTSFISEEGKRFSATVLDYNSCSVVGNRTQEKDGYIANILGYLKPKKLNKPQLKDFNKKNIEPKKIIKEQRLFNLGEKNGKLAYLGRWRNPHGFRRDW